MRRFLMFNFSAIFLMSFFYGKVCFSVGIKHDGILVKMKKEYLTRGQEILQKVEHVRGIQQIIVRSGDLYLLKTDDASFEKTLKSFRNHEAIDVAEPNYIYKIDPISPTNLLVSSVREGQESHFLSDPFFERLWGLYKTGINTIDGFHMKGIAGADINAVNAWKLTRSTIFMAMILLMVMVIHSMIMGMVAIVLGQLGRFMTMELVWQVLWPM